MLCRFLSFFFQAEDGIRDLVRSRGLGDVYKRQTVYIADGDTTPSTTDNTDFGSVIQGAAGVSRTFTCLLYTSDAADERSSVDLGGRRIIKKKNIGVHIGPSLTAHIYTKSTT